MTTSLVWFKTDLRLEDNETLLRAIAQSDEIIPVYCFDEDHFKTTKFSFRKTGNYRAQFIIESVKDLDNQLRLLGSGLVVVKGNPKIEIPKLAKAYYAQKVYCKKEVAEEEKLLELEIEKELWKFKCTLETYSTSTLYHAEDLPFSIKDIPDVFTNFRKRIEKESSIRDVYNKPETIKSPVLPPSIFPTLQELDLQPIKIDERSAINFKGGESEALKRLQNYFFDTKALAHYKETRNGMIGENYSSKFSAWLAQGCISARTIYHEIKQFEKLHGANESTYWLEFELLWRDYFRFMFKKCHHKFFLQYGIKEPDAYDLKRHEPDIFFKWMNGQTGVEFVDANMIELKLTGYMSNRGRQNVASYLCNDLKLDWRYGAAYFEEQLIDYDVCSNWGNWAYIAGVGNDPRKDRYFNIDKQANDYDPKHEYRKLWLKK